MARYAVGTSGTAATMSTSNSLAAVWTVTGTGILRRFRVLDVVFGCSGTPGDTAMVLQAQRSTTAATGGTAITPTAMDPADVACGATSMVQPSMTDGTKTAGTIMLSLSLNQRSTVRWFAAPGEEMVVPATASNGIHFPTPVAPGLAGVLTIVFDE